MLLEKSLLTLLISLVFYILLFVFKLKRKSLKEIFWATLIFIYGVLVVHVTLLPLPLDKIGSEMLRISSGPNYINLIPLVDLKDYNFYSFVRQMICNIIMFLPLGFLLPVYSSNFLNIKNTIKASFLISLFIESLQLLISFLFIHGAFRIFDVNDLIMNTLGGLIGFLVYTNLKFLLSSKNQA